MGGIRAVIVAAAMLAPCACGLDRAGIGSNPADAASLGPADAADAAGDAKAPPDGAGGGDDAGAGCVLDGCQGDCCAGCATGGIFCPSAAGPGGTCVADCAACAPSGGLTGTTCYTCAATVLSARCESSPSACPGDLDAGACPCPTGTAEQCPGPRQSCVIVDGQYVCLSD